MTLVHTPETISAQGAQTTFEEFLQILQSLRLSPIRVEIDVDAATVRVDGEDVPLCLKEFELLSHLATNADRDVSRAELFETVWQGRGLDSTSRTVDSHIRRLRAKLGAADLISTVRGQGYRFNRTAHVRLRHSGVHTLAA
ncbi:winged helix-turn-helix transcriptional regulator [Schaalia sp. 19OD2882]|uniref:winged helix-turn-helix domain-containing protein n=1 Tax=Schaalia sp. 19OD2882 TaxID=2794089 RepID=UPI001C1F1E6A|nr:winged helix-turn-helix domain-containing protein [Schaalia sp. 19OD2882]QWW20405.1 winged helix-turn-helix transcriptional regulator [Schaalia sp. 19OD2882]